MAASTASAAFAQASQSMAFSASPSALSASLLSSPISLACSAPFLPLPSLPLSPLPLLPPLSSTSIVTALPSAAPSSVPHLPSSLPTDASLLYSPSAGPSPSSLQKTSQTDADSMVREMRSYMAYCMDRFLLQEKQIYTLARQYEDVVSRFGATVVQQNAELQALRANDTHKDTLIRTLSEEITQLRTRLEEHSQFMDTRLREVSAPVPVTEIQEKIATIQTEVQRHSEWVEMARKKPSVHSVTVSETLVESDRRAQRSLNLRIRGIERSDTASPLQQAQDFVTQTMGITDHGVVSAYRAGTDLSRQQPLILRFRDAETRLAVLRRRRRLRELPQIHLDEDLTPLQWQDYRVLLPQRHAARQEGLWAVIRDGRLITRPLRTKQPVATSSG